MLDYLVYGEGTKRGVQRGVQKKGGTKKGGTKKGGYKKKGGTKKGVQKKGVQKKGVQKKGGTKKRGVQKRGGTKGGGTKKGYKKVPKSFSRGPTEGTVEIFFMFNNKFRVSWCYGFFLLFTSNKSALLDYLVYGEGTKRGGTKGGTKKRGYKKGGVQKKGVQKKGGTKWGVQKKGGYKKKGGTKKRGVQKRGGTKGGVQKRGVQKSTKKFFTWPYRGHRRNFFHVQQQISCVVVLWIFVVVYFHNHKLLTNRTTSIKWQNISESRTGIVHEASVVETNFVSKIDFQPF